MNELKENGLRLFEISSTTEPFKNMKINEVSDLITFIDTKISGEYCAVLYLYNEVLIGNYNNGFSFYDNKTFDLNDLIKMRIFNNDTELLLWKNDDNFCGRIRKDSSNENGNNSKVVEVKQILYGTNSENLENGFVRLFEDRGTEVILPGNFDIQDAKNRVSIKTRNYIEYNDLNQAVYVDCRFVNFEYFN